MKHIRTLAAAGALVLTLGCGTALAAEGGIAVQLDGKDLAFTDAVPQVRENRTFLPFRAVFEAMGAKVDYSASANTVTAKKGDTTVTMALGGTTATVENGGFTSQVPMDVAPFAENGRTYVPVRFAAQAMGCAVGWDQDDQTVILVDTGKAVEDTLAKHSFTYLEKFAAYYGKYMTGAWSMDAKFDGSATLMGASPIGVSGTMNGVVADGKKMEADMKMKMDMLDFIKAMNEMSEAQGAEPTPITAEDLALLKALKNEGIGMAMRGDLTDAIYYNMTLPQSLADQTSLDNKAWYSMDLGSLMSTTGVDMEELMGFYQDLDFKDLIPLALAGVSVDDKDTGYTELMKALDTAAAVLSDEGFVKDGDTYTTTYSLDQSGVAVAVKLGLTMKSDKVTGYDMGMSMTVKPDAVTDPQTAALMGEGVAMSMECAMDAKDNMTANVNLDVGALMEMELNMTGSYKTSAKAPQTQPPTGATVVPFEQLMTPGV